MNGWHPATLGAHPGAERVVARLIGEQIVYRYPGDLGPPYLDLDARVHFPETVHPAPWWYRLAVRLMPSRCREIPEAQNPGRVLLRQVAIIKRCVYLQGFASGEDPRWLHRHGRHLLVLGIWGGYTERRSQGSRAVRAPYAYAMLPATLHQVTAPTPGHTSIAIMWGRGERGYVSADGRTRRTWREHTKVRVRQV